MRRAWLFGEIGGRAMLGVLLLLAIVVPLLNLAVPADSAQSLRHEETSWTISQP